MSKKKSKKKNKADKSDHEHKSNISRKYYEAELSKLQAELVKLQL